MVKQRDPRSLTGKVLYGTLFVVAIPALLAFWSAVLDRSLNWQVPGWPLAIVLGIVSSGIFVMVKGMFDLYRHGGGLPMNAYPPAKLVTEGIYAYVSHPIYLGAVVLAIGIALWQRSGGGLYIVSPILALAILALVYGYERLALRKRFGDAVSEYRPLLSIAVFGKATIIKKLAVSVAILLPWLLAGYLIDYARCTATCDGVFYRLFSGQFLQSLTTVLWFIPYTYVAIRLVLSRNPQQLLHFSIASILAAGLGMYLYLVLPLLHLNIVQSVWVDVVAFVVVFLALNYAPIWRALQRICEWVANSRVDWLFFDGRFRIMNHSIYAGMGAAVGVGIIGYVTQNEIAAIVLLIFCVVGAAAFAQVMWGSKALLRPFGYWGAIWGGIIGIGITHYVFQIPLSQIGIAAVLAAPFTQAVGRLRCLVQGCCHGTPTNERLGIRVWQPQSRVCVLSKLTGQYILITQLYSILFNLLLGPFLWALWVSQVVSSPFVVGMYLILTGIERFAEDGYRGETQTPVYLGLKESQWNAIVGLLVGIVITMIPSEPPSLVTSGLSLSLVIVSLVGGLFGAFAMGMDFPKSTARFSRLSG